jgi:hypothetical protein
MTLLAPRDVGRRLQLSTRRVIHLDREGRLHALRDSAGRRFYLADGVERFAAERESQGRVPGRGLPVHSALAHACDTDHSAGAKASRVPILDEARSAYRVGLCIVPAAADGTKRPDVPR